MAQPSTRRRRDGRRLALFLLGGVVIATSGVTFAASRVDGTAGGAQDAQPAATGAYGATTPPSTAPTALAGTPAATAKPTAKSASNPSTAKGKPIDYGSLKVSPVKSFRGAIDQGTAVEAVKSYLTTVPRIPPQTTKVDQLVGGIAGTAVQMELEAQLAELDANGWTMRGEPTIKSASFVSQDLHAKQPVVEIKVCVDSSNVVTVDHRGKPVGSVRASGPSFNLYTLQQQSDSSWLLINHSFPNNPGC